MSEYMLWETIDEQKRKIADLEKEKAELKEQNKNYEQLIENGSVTLVKERLKNYKQLIKAKKIIREYKTTLETLVIHKKLNKDKYGFLVEKAEAFLKEVDK